MAAKKVKEVGSPLEETLDLKVVVETTTSRCNSAQLASDSTVIHKMLDSQMKEARI